MLQLLFSAERFQVIGRNAPIVTALGEDVILPCYLEPSISAQQLQVRWSRDDSEDSLVFLQDQEIKYENQMPSYMGRASLFPEELKSGNISLKLRKVQVSDHGAYKCLVKSKVWDDMCVIKVEVRGEYY